jgi:hypothetical protein
MIDTSAWPLPTLAAALGVPDEAFRAFAHLNNLAWDARLPLLQCVTLAVAWQDAAGETASGPVADAAGALFAALRTAMGPAPVQ